MRTTKVFTAASVPRGLLAAHQVADGVWGRLVVLEGVVEFVVEATGASRAVGAGERQVIEPGMPHHVVPDDAARFVVEFWRPADPGSS